MVLSFGLARDELLNAVKMRTAVPITRDRSVAVPPDPPVSVDATQLTGGEVVDALVLLDIDCPIGEDEMRVNADRTRGGLHPSQESGPQPTRYVVDRPARVHEIELVFGQISRRVAMHPAHLDAGAPREALGLAEAGGRDIHGGHLTPPTGGKDAGAPLPPP